MHFTFGNGVALLCLIYECFISFVCCVHVLYLCYTYAHCTCVVSPIQTLHACVKCATFVSVQRLCLDISVLHFLCLCSESLQSCVTSVLCKSADCHSAFCRLTISIVIIYRRTSHESGGEEKRGENIKIILPKLRW